MIIRSKNPMQKVYVTPTTIDVLCGRGIHNFKHPGNQSLRSKIVSNLEEYLKCTRRGEKTAVIRRVYEEIIDHGGRFLKYDNQLKGWYDGGRDTAKVRVGVAFRDAKIPNKVRYIEHVKADLAQAAAVAKQKRNEQVGEAESDIPSLTSGSSQTSPLTVKEGKERVQAATTNRKQGEGIVAEIQNKNPSPTFSSSLAPILLLRGNGIERAEPLGQRVCVIGSTSTVAATVTNVQQSQAVLHDKPSRNGDVDIQNVELNPIQSYVDDKIGLCAAECSLQILPHYYDNAEASLCSTSETSIFSDEMLETIYSIDDHLTWECLEEGEVGFIGLQQSLPYES